MATIHYETLTLDELRTSLDEMAREKLGISGEEFIRRYRDRQLDMTSPAVSRLAVLARLLFSATGE